MRMDFTKKAPLWGPPSGAGLYVRGNNDWVFEANGVSMSERRRWEGREQKREIFKNY